MDLRTAVEKSDTLASVFVASCTLILRMFAVTPRDFGNAQRASGLFQAGPWQAVR